MAERSFEYIIIGAGLAGAAAAEAIRKIDHEKPVLLIGAEKHLPYHRPPLSKALWSGGKRKEDIFVHKRNYYDHNRIELRLGLNITAVDAGRKIITAADGQEFSYNKLLIATGGIPRRPALPGADLEGISYLNSGTRLWVRSMPVCLCIWTGRKKT